MQKTDDRWDRLKSIISGDCVENESFWRLHHMRLEPDKEVRILVTHSECDLMKKGDSIFLKGPLIDNEKSAPICITALLAIYPWVMTSRFGIESKNLDWDNEYRVWCPEKLVEFTITRPELSHLKK